MKRAFILIVVIFSAIAICISCKQYHHGDINITISESGNMFSMTSHFNEEKTHDVLAFMDRRLGNANHFSFVNSKLDATLTLEDQTNMYVKTKQGYVEIKMDKSKNSYENYKRVKNMCEGIKEVIK